MRALWRMFVCAFTHSWVNVAEGVAGPDARLYCTDCKDWI